MAGPGRLPLDSSTRHIPVAPPAQSNDMSLPTAHISRPGSVLPHGLDSLRGKRSIPWDPLPPRPPHAAPQIMDQGRNHARTHEDRVEQHAEGDDEGELEEEHDRDHR